MLKQTNAFAWYVMFQTKTHNIIFQCKSPASTRFFNTSGTRWICLSLWEGDRVVDTWFINFSRREQFSNNDCYYPLVFTSFVLQHMIYIHHNNY